MKFDPGLAERRFGCGTSPKVAPPRSATEMIQTLADKDHMAAAFPITSYQIQFDRVLQFWRLRARERKALKRGLNADKFRRQAQKTLRGMRNDSNTWMAQSLLRAVWTSDGFRERLAHFWFDHFSAPGRTGPMQTMVGPYVETVIRPRLTGSFADLLIAATTHPQMMHFLDQNTSIGPQSVEGEKQAKLGKRRGLNENLAREVLELHTLGVGGPYSQKDVRQLAELFTGLSVEGKNGMVFNPARAQPGIKTVLDRSYGVAAGSATLNDIHALLVDLAVHPVTAHHLSLKLATHFISDQPSNGLVDAMTRRYLETRGELLPVYEAMLSHPDAWSTDVGNFKPPVAFVASAMRALAVPRRAFQRWGRESYAQHFLGPFDLMGQTWLRPLGPDGWAEEDTYWLSPQGLAARLRWSMLAPAAMLGELPDPRRFLIDALGDSATPETVFAAKAAESRVEGVAMVLMSPEFQHC